MVDPVPGVMGSWEMAWVEDTVEAEVVEEVTTVEEDTMMVQAMVTEDLEEAAWVEEVVEEEEEGQW